MCFPLVAAQLAVTAATAVAGFASQEQQYSEEEARFQQNYTDALSDNRTTEQRLQAQEMEENAQYTQKDQLALIEGAEKQAQAQTAAATTGVAGNSVQDIVNSIGSQINYKRADLNEQWQAQVTQTESEKVSAVEQEKSRMGEVANPISPSPVGAILGVVGAGLKLGSGSGSNFFGTTSDGGGATTPDEYGQSAGLTQP